MNDKTKVLILLEVIIVLVVCIWGVDRLITLKQIVNSCDTSITCCKI